MSFETYHHDYEPNPGPRPKKLSTVQRIPLAGPYLSALRRDSPDVAMEKESFAPGFEGKEKEDGIDKMSVGSALEVIVNLAAADDEDTETAFW